MGQSKQYLQDCEERGYWSVNTYICSKCVEDSFLAHVVQENLESKKCDYCNYESENEISTSFENVMECIALSIQNSYSDVQNTTMPWVEGQFLMECSYTDDILEEYDPGWSEHLRDDIASALAGSDWVRTEKGDWTAVSRTFSLVYGWNNFKEQIIERTRYLFLLDIEDDHFYDEDQDSIPVTKMLRELGILANRLNLISKIPSESTLYRVRSVDKGIILNKFSDIGLPPVGKSSAGRMNPAGIPYFYLAFDQKTAIIETINVEKPNFNIGKFSVLSDLNILDLTILPELPSKLNYSQYNRRCRAVLS